MSRRFPYTPLALAGLLTAGALAALLTGAMSGAGPLADLQSLVERLGVPMLRLTLFISIGLAVGYLLEASGWTDRISVFFRPLARWGHLDGCVGAAFITAFFSGTSSITMLMSFFQEGRISRKEVTLGVLLNTFPSFFLHLPTTFFILVPLAGRAGALYLGLTFCAALLRLGAVLAYGHLALPKPAGPAIREKERKKKAFQEVLRDFGDKFLKRLTRIMIIVLPVYCAILWVSHIGFFDWARESLSGWVGSSLIPVDAMSIVVVSLAAEFTSGYAAAGAMLEAGTLTVFQTVLALLVGNVVAAPIRAFRHQMPVYMGVFGPRLGATLMVATQSFRMASLLAVGILFFFAAWGGF